MTSVSEHIDWCIERAMGYANRGNMNDAKMSFISDISKHPETKHHQQSVSMMLTFRTFKTATEFETFIKQFVF